MLIRILTSFFLISLFIHNSAQNKKMCITVDDLPAVTGGISEYDFRLDITTGLVNTFKKYNIPAIGYVNERKLYDQGQVNSMEVKLLELWLQSGLELGNHTFSHMNYHKASFKDYTEDVIKGEKVIKRLGAKYDTQIKYFRHPYLRIGLSSSHADSLRDFLHKQGYVEAPVTIDNTDYLFAAAFTKAYQRDDLTLMDRIAKDYIDYMEDKLIFYESQSQKLFDRNINQTLLIHANLLNALYLDELVNMYVNHGYGFISQSEVLQDPAYNEEITNYGNWGISWIDRWALSRGERGDFFKGDPKTPDYIRDLMN